MKNIAIIPARGRSKRILHKNIKEFLGKPIIFYSIQAAIKSELFDEIMVSTDDDEIAKVAIQYGASVPFLRSAKNSDDYATTEDVLLEVIKKYQQKNFFYDYCCCLYPTAPLIQHVKLIETYELMKRKNFDAIFPIIRFSYPIQRSLKLKDGKVEMNWKKYNNTRSQDLPSAFHDAGQFYWLQVGRFIINKKILTDNCGGFEISEMEAQDIDNETDWKLAELKYKILVK